MTRFFIALATLSLTTAGCDDNLVEISGTVLTSRFARDASDGLAGAKFRLLDARAEPTDAANPDVITASDGTFTAKAPEVQTIYSEIVADGYTTTSFTGGSGGISEFTVPPFLLDSCDIPVPIEGNLVPSLYGMTLSERAELEALYAGCPGVGESGGIIVGQTRYFLFVESDVGGVDSNGDPCVGVSQDPDNEPPATVRKPQISALPLDTLDELNLVTCYLNDDGTAYDAAATHAGPSQSFAIFAVPSGRYTVEARFELTETAFTQSFFDIWVPVDGVVPRFPLWIEFPLF